MSDHLATRRKVLIAYDNSEICKNVFNWAKQQIFRPNQDHVTIITVTENGESFFEANYVQTMLSGKMGFEQRKNFQKEVSEKAEETVAKLSSELSEMGITSNPYVIKAEDAKDAIVEATKTLKADLLIIGSRGLHPFKRVILGSVSEYCINNCECPVLVHKGH
ncbi:adenine nucleotide alpha hydrolases-like protein [Neoconidiobolus thromboides FSU 785]|nr:adenine nucleotide alpha hydrolases-like protein [Neoconidiobolus thromboides FSU 785]